jgi:DNA polymerase III epsilon subunit family exonuclease
MTKRLETSVLLEPSEIEILLAHFPKGMVAFDLEMTGLSPTFDKIIEIAAVKVDADGSVSTFHEMVNPLITIPEYTIEFHGITNDMVRDSRSLKLPLREFTSFYGNLPLLAHNAQFDMGFIVRGNHEFNYPFSLSDIYDSCKFPRALYKKETGDDRPKNFKLSSLAEFYEFDFNHHQALDDALISLKIFIKCLTKFETYTGKRTLRDLCYLFKINSFKKPIEYELPKKLHAIQDCLRTRSEISIKYKGSSTGDNFRKVKPIALIPMPQGLILYAECLKDKMNKHFMVKKIKELKLEPPA